jgi:hypothetical protein
MQGQISDIHGRVTNIESEQKVMQGQISDLQEQTTNIHNSVVFIEVEHGKKIGALCDALVITEETSQKIDKLQNTVDKLKFGDEVIKLVNIVENRAT